MSCLKYYDRSADIGCCERPADCRKVWNIFFFLFSLYVCLLSIIIIFGVRNLLNYFLFCFDFFILFYFFFFGIDAPTNSLSSVGGSILLT